jgi:predicted kinase
LIHGYLGAGKTTLARRLERNIPAIRFSHDEWMVRLYGSDPPIEQFADFYRRIYEQVEEIWLRCLELGIDVVLDFGFWSRQERDDGPAVVANFVIIRPALAVEPDGAAEGEGHGSATGRARASAIFIQ